MLSVVEQIAQQSVDELHITGTVDEGENAGFQIRELEVFLKQTKVGGKGFRQSGEFVGAGRFQISQFTAQGTRHAVFQQLGGKRMAEKRAAVCADGLRMTGLHRQERHQSVDKVVLRPDFFDQISDALFGSNDSIFIEFHLHVCNRFDVFDGAGFEELLIVENQCSQMQVTTKFESPEELRQGVVGVHVVAGYFCPQVAIAQQSQHPKVDNGVPDVGIVQVQRRGAIRHTALSHYLFREIRQVQNRSRCVND